MTEPGTLVLLRPPEPADHAALQPLRAAHLRGRRGAHTDRLSLPGMHPQPAEGLRYRAVVRLHHRVLRLGDRVRDRQLAGGAHQRFLLRTRSSPARTRRGRGHRQPGAAHHRASPFAPALPDRGRRHGRGRTACTCSSPDFRCSSAAPGASARCFRRSGKSCTCSWRCPRPTHRFQA